ncbi:MAG: hypothetical protein L0H55_12405 [Candidatus Nitrosocosmicus sp.]|nr:hypothetical protein [Candidatus Nitrosocosmicus sp.]
MDILSLISVDIVFNLLSNVHLLGRYDKDKPQAFTILLLYGRSEHRKWCSDLFESSRNQMDTNDNASYDDGGRIYKRSTPVTASYRIT